MADVALEARGLRARQRASLAFSFVLDGIWVVLLLGLILRIGLAFFPGFGVDINLFQFWSNALAGSGFWDLKGPGDFYDQDFFTDYAPGYMYVLFLIGKLDEVFGFSPGTYEYILKLPAIAADLAGAYLLWRLLEGKTAEVRLGAAALYLALPPVLLIGAIWGQVDSVLAFFLLLSIYYISKDRPVRAGVAFTLGFLVKPQAIAALPVLAFWIMRQHPPRWVKPTPQSLEWLIGCVLVAAGALAAVGFQVAEKSGPAIAGVLAAATGGGLVLHRLLTDRDGADGGEPAAFPNAIPAIPRLWVNISAVSVGVLLVLIFPFFQFQPWDFVSQMRFSTEVYKVNSFWADNFWNMFGLFDSGFKPDVTGIEPGEGSAYGISNRAWGIGIYAIAVVAILSALRRKEGPGWLSLGVALSVLAFYTFVTRMHERYMFPVLLPLIAACVLIEAQFRWKLVLWGITTLVIVAHAVNLYHVYMYYNPNWLTWTWGYDQFASGDFLGTGLETVQVFSALLVASLIALLAFAFAYRSSPPGSEAT